MNERIEELAIRVVGPSRLHGGEFALFGNKDVEKFAELIIKECGVALSPMLRDMVSRGRAYDLIKQHFGVEEEYRPPVQETHCPHDILLDKYCKKCDDEVSNQLGKSK